MKNLKHLAFLFLALLFITSCEKETELLPENSKIDNQKIESSDLQNFKSISESLESGFDLESYQKSMGNMKKMESTQTSYQLDDFVETDLQFFYSPESFQCTNMPTEDFEEGISGSTSPDYINENTDSYMFSPGDILPGVSIHTMNNSGSSNDNFYLYDNGFSKALFVNYWVDYMIIDFTTNNVTAVNMDVFSIWDESDITIEVFGNSGSLGTTIVYGTNSGTYWGVKSNEPITRITLYSLSNRAEGIDNLSFGNCDDMDGDGFLNEVDAHPNSDMSEKINIGSYNPNVDNKMVKNGTMMMDQINDLIDQTNAQYYGENYTYLHKRFMTELAQITYRWRMSRLITATQRSQISSCAWGANIPYLIYD